MTTDTEDFKAMAKAAGVPTTAEEINAEFEKVRDAQGLTVTNKNAFGPFWKFVNAAATTAALWLINFVIEQVWPQSYVKTASGEALKKKAWDVDIEPKTKSKAKGFILFIRTETAGELLVPSESVVQSTPINGNIYSLKTLQDSTFSDGEETLLVECEALEEGSGYNLSAGYYTVLIDSIDGITGVTNLEEWLITPGSDDEDDEELRLRIRNQYAAVNQWHTDTVYRSIIASFDGVPTNNVFFEHDAPRGPGTANAYIMLEQGTISADILADIQSEITDKGNHGHGDDLEVKAMPADSHDLDVTVWLKDNLTPEDEAETLAAVENLVRCAFRENTDYNTTKPRPYTLFSFSKLGDELHDQVNNLVNVKFSLDVIDNQLAVPTLGTLSVVKSGA